MIALALWLATLTNVPASFGAQLYTTYCASCHGAQAWGSQYAPNLHGVGTAALDFYLVTGRMPAAVPWLEVEHRGERSGQALDPDVIAAIEDYLAPVVAGGPTIPIVVANGDMEHGRKLYALDCMQCHGVKALGGAIGDIEWAPELGKASITQVAEAVRVGPEEMPRFGPHQLSDDDLIDVASYVMRMTSDPQPPIVPPYRSTGPVPEGAVSYLVVIALVAFVFIFWRAETPLREREDAVRRDAAEEPL